MGKLNKTIKKIRTTMNIQEVAVLNSIMNKLTMKDVEPAKVITFINLKETIEQDVDKFNDDMKKINQAYKLVFNEEGNEIVSGDKEAAQAAANELFHSKSYQYEKFLTLDELVSMSSNLQGADLSFAKKMLVLE